MTWDPYTLSAIIVIAFVLLVACRAGMLRKRGIRAIVFGKTDKSDFLLVFVVALFVYPAIAAQAGLPMWPPLVRHFWEAAAPGWAGLAVCAVALAGFAATIVSFGRSFRVGIDEERPDKLVTTGMFAISRNPLYLFFILLFVGLFLVHSNIVATAAAIIFTLAMHRQILREETFLKEHYGAEYEDYCAKVRRYL